MDELGYVPLSKTGSELLFEIFSQRCGIVRSRSKRSTAESFRTSRPSAPPWPTSWSGTTRPGVSRSLGIKRRSRRARSMSYARRHSTNGLRLCRGTGNERCGGAPRRPRAQTRLPLAMRGWGWIFAAVEHWNAECVGWHVCKVGSRFALGWIPQYLILVICLAQPTPTCCGLGQMISWR